MNPFPQQVVRSPEAALATNKLIRNTYTLLSMTLLFSAATAGISVVMNLPQPGFLLTMVGFFGLFFLTAKLRNSVWGLASVFALTGFMGLTLGPLLNMYLALPNGSQIIMMAMGGTGTIFLGLSGYALTTRRDFSFMRGFLMVGLLVAVLGMLAVWLFNMPGAALGLSALIVLLMSGFILYDTSRMVHGGETNYIMATVGLYVNIYNLFISLLHIIGAFSGDD